VAPPNGNGKQFIKSVQLEEKIHKSNNSSSKSSENMDIYTSIESLVIQLCWQVRVRLKIDRVSEISEFFFMKNCIAHEKQKH
jgi:hypothetical protein